MRLTRLLKIQLAVFSVILLGGLWAVFIHYYNLPSRFFGAGVYTVRVQLTQADTLYEGGTSPTVASMSGG